MPEETADLDNILDVLGLTPSDPLDTLIEMWYVVFLWALFSSMFVHAVAAGVAFWRLRRQKLGRFAPIFILAQGFVAPLTSGLVTSVVIAGVYRACRFQMPVIYACFWGCGQTALDMFFAYTRLLATL